MNTPAHLIFGAALFARGDHPGLTRAALAGALIPDLSLYLLAGTHLLILGTPPQVVFGQLYFSEAWQSIFRIDNSFILWGIVLTLGIMARSKTVIALCGAALVHLMFDFPFHHDDGRAHFWPLTNWIFESPISYWDSRRHAGIVGSIELVAVVTCAVILWRRYQSVAMKVLIAVLVAAQFSTNGFFQAVF